MLRAQTLLSLRGCCACGMSGCPHSRLLSTHSIACCVRCPPQRGQHSCKHQRFPHLQTVDQRPAVLWTWSFFADAFRNAQIYREGIVEDVVMSDVTLVNDHSKMVRPANTNA